MIILEKKGEKSFSDVDKALLKQEIEKIKSENEFKDALGQDFLFIVSEGIGIGFSYLTVILSQYWYAGGGDENEDFEFAKENDLTETEKVAEKLKTVLGQNFEIKACFENW